MRILVMYKLWASYLPRFVAEGKKRGAAVTLAHFADVVLRIKEGTAVLEVQGQTISNFDLVYVRSVGQYHEEMAILADYCKLHTITLLERSLIEGNVDRDHKSFEALRLLSAGLHYPRSFFGNREAILDYLERLKHWPVVMKDTGGKRGRAVYLVKDLATATRILQGRVKHNYVVQDYIKNDGEYRVWVIGGKVVGAMHRPTRGGELELVGMTGKSKRVEPSAEMQKLAIAAAKTLEIDAAAIDMVKDMKTGKLYVLEVNRAGVFATFEKVTKLNVIGAIMEWLVEEARR